MELIGKGKRVGLRKAIGTAVLACAFSSMINAGTAGAEVTFDSMFGSNGSGKGQFSNPSGIAVNQSTGEVYVADSSLNRIEQFDSAGTFIRMWGHEVNQTTSGDICPVNPSDTCQAPGSTGNGAASAFSSPRGIAVDNSPGPSHGDVYVEDYNYNRIQKFTADGHFILMWGKEVNKGTNGNICSASETCQAGSLTGNNTTKEESEPGVFAGLSVAPGLATDEAGNVYVGDFASYPFPRVQKFAPDGTFLSQAAPSGPSYLGNGGYLAVDARGNMGIPLFNRGFYVFPFTAFSESGLDARNIREFDPPTQTPFYGVTGATVDPADNFFFFGDTTPSGCHGHSSGVPLHILEVRIPDEELLSGQEVDCTDIFPPGATKVAGVSGIAISSTHKLYLSQPEQHRVLIYGVPSEEAPEVSEEHATGISTTSAEIESAVVANLGNTKVRVEYGLSPCSEVPNPCQETPLSRSVGSAESAVDSTVSLKGLEADTTYYYRVVAENGAGSSIGSSRSFKTFSKPAFDPSCPNNLARQQTGSAFLFDCRGYELVSAEDAGGYDVESDLVSSQTPFGGYPKADDRALYGIHDGVIPGSGKPTNHGIDPYVAVRDEADQRWDTSYVGIPADAPSAESFASTLGGSDGGLESFAFEGPELCDPCFEDGTIGIPIHTPSGQLEQGMSGSIAVSNPVSVGRVAKHFSGDGSHFVFASTQQFEPAGNSSGTDVSVYDRDLSTNTTQVASTLPGGTAIENGTGVAELDISEDGSRIVIGELLATDSAGNKYWHLYMHVGTSPDAIDLTPGTTSGVLYDGMTSDGTDVYFTTVDPLVTAEDQDTDTSADIFRAQVSGATATLTRVSVGAGLTGNTDGCDPSGNSYDTANWNVVPGGPTDCSVVAVGGGGGVAAKDGSLYFLSPELLDGSEGLEGAPNLYIARPGSSPRFVATLESSASTPFPPSVHAYEHSFGTFENPAGVAIDHETGSTYVLDDLDTTEESPGAFVEKLDASGNVDPSFGTGGKINGSESPTGQFLEFGTFGGEYGLWGVPTSIAVDNNPASPSYRDLYVPDMGNAVIDKFGPAGNYISQISVGDYVTGVAVNPVDSRVYVVGYFGGVYVYSPSGTPEAEFSGPGEIQDVAADSSGRIYIATGSQVSRYSESGTFEKVFDSNPSYGVRVDSDDHVYVDHGAGVVEFDTSGTQIGPTIGSGLLTNSVSLAVDQGRMVVSNKGAEDVAEFGAPLTPPGRGYDHPLVVDSVKEPSTRHTGDFQVGPSGNQAVFASTLPLTGFENDGKYEVFRYDAVSETTTCVSCNPTGAQPTTDSSLASNGLSLADDGRVFFDTGEPLVLRDTNDHEDAYEWKSGKVELISTGTSNLDSSLMSITADGTDAFFFTHEQLTRNDRNGTLTRLYDARVDGGFFSLPPLPPCAASDECHGPGSKSAPPAPLGTLNGTLGNVEERKPCRRGYVRKHGRCVKRRRHKHKHRGHRKHGHHRRKRAHHG